MDVLTILAGLTKVAAAVQSQLAVLSSACSSAMTALDNAKADKVTLTALTIQASGWRQDNDTGWPWYIDVAASGITAEDVAAVQISADSRAVAEAAGLMSSVETRAGVLRLRARHAPAAAMSAYYYIIREDILMAYGPLAVGSSPYTLPAATADTLGGIKVGDNLNIDADGKLSGPAPYTLTEEDISAKLGFAPSKITCGTADLTAGSSELTDGAVYLVYSDGTQTASETDEEV